MLNNKRGLSPKKSLYKISMQMNAFKYHILYVQSSCDKPLLSCNYCIMIKEGGRPAVIVSNDVCNEHSRVVEVVFLTTKEKPPLPTHVKINSKLNMHHLIIILHLKFQSYWSQHIVKYDRTTLNNKRGCLLMTSLFSSTITHSQMLELVENHLLSESEISRLLESYDIEKDYE